MFTLSATMNTVFSNVTDPTEPVGIVHEDQILRVRTTVTLAGTLVRYLCDTQLCVCLAFESCGSGPEGEFCKTINLEGDNDPCITQTFVFEFDLPAHTLVAGECGKQYDICITLASASSWTGWAGLANPSSDGGRQVHDEPATPPAPGEPPGRFDRETGSSSGQWRQQAGFSLFFDSLTGEAGERSWRTRLYHEETGDETTVDETTVDGTTVDDSTVPGGALHDWVRWILARVAPVMEFPMRVALTPAPYRCRF